MMRSILQIVLLVLIGYSHGFMPVSRPATCSKTSLSMGLFDGIMKAFANEEVWPLVYNAIVPLGGLTHTFD